MTREQFFATLAPLAVRARREGSPMFPSVRLAQNLLETGGVIHSWNNLGGIKVGSGRTTPYWRGRTVSKDTWEVYDGRRVEESADFRAYDSVYDYYKDQDLLFELSRYAPVRNAKTPEAQARALQTSGYATDPQYASKLISIINTYDLKRFDRQAAQTTNRAVSVPVLLNGQEIATGYVLDNVSWGPARTVGAALGASIGWNGRDVTVNGEPWPTMLVGSVGYVPLREFGTKLGAQVSWDAVNRAVRLTKS